MPVSCLHIFALVLKCMSKKRYGGVEVCPQSFLTSALYGGGIDNLTGGRSQDLLEMRLPRARSRFRHASVGNRTPLGKPVTMLTELYRLKTYHSSRV
jgi:hypothetical protein